MGTTLKIATDELVHAVEAACHEQATGDAMFAAGALSVLQVVNRLRAAEEKLAALEAEREANQ